MPSRRAPRHVTTALFSLLLGAVLGVACGPPGPGGGSCRYNPLCGTGELGATCDRNSDCVDRQCCEKDECDGGTCSLRCDKDRDCPGGLSCHGGWCYFNCNVHADCASGQRCKNDRFCSWD